ncbi:hypothetical protein [Novosphingobium sp.]|uniref:hypothetical protein n=1 Tax=Novosphingobium sp. TaxID=1874826 RepID=UPI0038BCB719
MIELTRSTRRTVAIRTVSVSLCSFAALMLVPQAAQAQDAAVPRTAEQQAATWQEIARQPDFWQGTWQSISPIADDFSKTPDYTPAALDYIKRYKPAEDSPFTNCKPLGMPFVQNIGGMPMKFFQSPGMIAVYIESSGMTRFIHTDGRKHSEQPNPSYLGESIGHWEGDTLVVDTTGLAADTIFQMGTLPASQLRDGDHSPLASVIFGKHGPNLRLVERLRLIDFNTLELQLTIYDDTIFKQPYSPVPRRFLRGIEQRNEPQEWACTDNRDYFDEATGKLEINVKDKAQDR